MTQQMEMDALQLVRWNQAGSVTHQYRCLSVHSAVMAKSLVLRLVTMEQTMLMDATRHVQESLLDGHVQEGMPPQHLLALRLAIME